MVENPRIDEGSLAAYLHVEKLMIEEALAIGLTGEEAQKSVRNLLPSVQAKPPSEAEPLPKAA